MELRLCLSLPTQNPVKGFDLNDKVLEPEEKKWRCSEKKRSFDEAYGEFKDASETLLPLVLWCGKPNEEDDRNRGNKRISCSINKSYGDENEDQVVGWPPIKSWHKRLLHEHHQGGCHVANINGIMAREENVINGGGSNYMFVKVKMEGVTIARKIDLRLYHSYDTLKSSLINMFTKCQELDKDVAGYTLAYLDKDGEWLIAGDIPWQTFVESVQRLEIIRNV